MSDCRAASDGNAASPRLGPQHFSDAAPSPYPSPSGRGNTAIACSHPPLPVGEGRGEGLATLTVMRLAFTFAVILTATAACAQGKSASGESQTRALKFSDSNPSLTRFGKLDFLGGLEWSANRADFGGFSGMLLDEDGTITALTDKAHWARAKLIFDDNGALSDIEGLEVWRLYGADGGFLQRPFTDAEGITRDGDNLLISFEGRDRVSRFAGLWGPEQPVAGLPAALDDLRTNKGLEGLLKLPDGRLVMVAEEPIDTDDNIGWILEDGTARPFAITRTNGFSPTDLALGPDGETVYLLERRYSFFGGPGMRIRRFALAELEPDALIEGETLIEAGAGEAVDNMEALATRRGPGGETELLVLSDDNFSFRQRTLLLHFRVVEE